jgi:hypothetical protein
LLLLRLTFEINRNTHDQRTVEYLDLLDEITPDFELYKAVFDALVEMKSSNKDGTDKNYLESRPMLGEWVKFSLQLAVREETTRRSLVSMIFRFIGKVEHSFADYEHLLRSRK